MRVSKYEKLNTEFKNRIDDFHSDVAKSGFIKKTKSGQWLYNFKKFSVLKNGKEQVKVCHFCINKMACDVLENKFCGGNTFYPEDEFLPNYKKIENSSQLSGAIGYFYSHLAGHYKKLCDDEDQYYQEHKIKKDDGSFRIIHAPEIRIKLIQQAILEKVLYKYIKFPKHVTGFMPGKNVVDNATPHVKKSVVVRLDLKDFFPSVFAGVVHKKLRKYFPPHVCNMIVRLCSYKEHMAQGIPTSPYLANLACDEMDKDILKLCKSRRWDYTRYADDLTFSVKSGREDVSRNVVDDFIREVYKIVGKSGYRINSQKTHVMRRGKRQTVTGIIVNEKVNIPKHFRRTLRAIIHNSNKRGIQSQLRGAKTGEFKRRVSGLLAYTKIVNPVVWERLNNEWEQARYEKQKNKTS